MRWAVATPRASRRHGDANLRGGKFLAPSRRVQRGTSCCSATQSNEEPTKLEEIIMAQGATTKDKGASAGRAPRAQRRQKAKTDRTSRDTRSRSRANDERKAKRTGRTPEKSRSPAR